MRKLNEIFQKRLERIRDELNIYIDSYLTLSEPKLSAPSVGGGLEKTHDSVMDKFLNYMKLNDDEEYSDSDYLDDEGIEALPQEMPPKKADSLAPSRKKTCSKPSGPSVPVAPRRLSNSLKKDRERPELDQILEKKEESFSAMLLRMIDEKGLKDSEVYKLANIDRRLFSKIRGDEYYVPSRKTAISFCLALQLTVDEAKKLLATAGYTLSSSSRFDLIIMYLIETKEYNIQFANIVLDDYGEGSLSR